MVYLEYPAYVEVDGRSRRFSLYNKWFKKLLISRTRLSRIPRLCRSIFKVPCPISPGLSRSAVNFPVCLPYLAFSNHVFTSAAVESNDNCPRSPFPGRPGLRHLACVLGVLFKVHRQLPPNSPIHQISSVQTKKCWRSNLDISDPRIFRSFFEVPRTSR